jgi:TonB family protein
MRTCALIYRPGSRWPTWAAFFCAATIFAGAICLGRTQIEPPLIALPSGDSVDISIDGETEPVEVPDEDRVPDTAPQDEDAFPEERVEQRPPVVKKERPSSKGAAPSAHSPGSVTSPRGRRSALYAPRPDYPYEARRQNATGSGIASLTIDQSGLVTGVRMQRSTGKPILDASAMRAFSRWRFRPGTNGVMFVPIVFTLTGASF